MQMIVNCVAYKNGVRIRSIAVEDISEVLKQDSTFVWLGLHEPSEALLLKIQEEFNLHELAIEDAHHAHQRPKLEEYGDSLFVVLQTGQLLDNAIHFGETLIFVGRRFLVSVRHGPSLSYAKVRNRCELAADRLAQGPGFALYAIMDFVVDNYRPIVDSLQARLETIEATIFKQRFSQDCLQDLYDLRRQLVLLQSAAEPLLEICNSLIRFHTDIIPKEARAYFRDIHDHVRGVTQATSNMREMLTTAMQVNLSLVTVAQNEVVKKLAGWGAILAIPTMVFSLYGMNFKHMPELDAKLGYPIVILVVILGCLWVYRRLKRAGWL
ncbi:MAG: magnesium and cobalt transport protein CorA [Burkholderiales bacterium]|nr:magnesium and cobalt transport protein CorA [Burkholderiales bacterium]